MTILKIIYGDIKDEGGNADVVVNASNEAMVIGDGVAGAIGAACGEPALTCDSKEFIRELKEVHNMAKVPTGSMGVTGAHAMTRAKAIYHAVAPICASRNSRTLDQARQLRMAYTLVFEAAAAHEYKVVTLPFLGAGIFNYPREESVDFALICALNACSSITSVEEIRFVSLNKDSHRAIARANRVLMALQPRPPIRRTVMGAVAAMVHGEDIPRKIKLGSVKKADKAEVDYFIVFGDYCIDPNGLQIDLGPFGAFKDQIVHALSQSSQSDSDWASAVISLTIAGNLRPKELICIVRQNGNASFSGLLKLIAENLSFHRRDPPFAKVGVIIPTTCVLNDKYRFLVPIFLILCVWKHSMTQLKGAVMLWSGTDREKLRKALNYKEEFTKEIIDEVMERIDTNDGLICVPLEGGRKGFDFRHIIDDHLLPATTTRRPHRTPRFLSSPTPIRDCDSPGISQIFSNLRTCNNAKPKTWCIEEDVASRRRRGVSPKTWRIAEDVVYRRRRDQLN